MELKEEGKSGSSPSIIHYTILGISVLGPGDQHSLPHSISGRNKLGKIRAVAAGFKLLVNKQIKTTHRPQNPSKYKTRRPLSLFDLVLRFLDK